MASSLSAPVRSAGSTMRGINGLGSKPKRARNLPKAELGRLSRLASRMTVLWAATVLEHFPRPGSQFRQGRRALAHGQLRSEHVDEIEQGQQGSSRAEAVFCHFPSPVGSHSRRRCRHICRSRRPPRRRSPGVPASRCRPGGRGGGTERRRRPVTMRTSPSLSPGGGRGWLRRRGLWCLRAVVVRRPLTSSFSGGACSWSSSPLC